MDYKKYIAELIQIDGVSTEEIYDCIALPPNTEMGDYALPCFKFAKVMRKSPVMIAEELKNSIAKNKIQKQIAIKLKRLSIEKQQELVNKYLNKVSIVFSKINKSNNNITECCDIHYEGREYKKLSKSQQARADLEISNLFNNLSGINAPVFFDDAESTTEIEEMSNNQMIISLVIKHNPLEILDDYDEVLDRKQKSVEREIAESSKYIIDIAAKIIENINRKRRK